MIVASWPIRLTASNIESLTQHEYNCQAQHHLHDAINHDVQGRLKPPVPLNAQDMGRNSNFLE